MSLVIRQAIRADAAALSELALRSKAHWPYDDAFIEACRSDLTVSEECAASGFFWLGESAGSLVGFYGFSNDDSDPVMTFLFVEPQSIGQGFGFALWRHAVEFGRSRGWCSFQLTGDPFATDALYYKVGCVKIGEIESTVSKGRMLPLLRYSLLE